MTQHSATALQHVEDDPANMSRTLDPFTVTTSNGFMPLQTPQTELPKAFDPLIKLCERMPIVKEDGSPGLLASYQLGPTIDLSDALPDLTDEIDNLLIDGKPDLVAATAIFRDYSFLASAYLLEPCWEKWSKDSQQGYGLGRQRLPRNLAGPLTKTAKLINMPPFMSYVAYSTYNYKFADPSVGTSKYDNLRLVRAFEHGFDPASSEAGFVLTHVDMVKHSPDLIKGAVDMLNSVSAGAGPEVVSEAFHHMLDAMQRIETSMETMWANSRPKDYIQFRTFIFGITNQSMFPDGVVYEGENNEEPMSFRGESGANDSIIPLLDNLLQIPMPENPLTTILKDFRSYRPKPHREFLEYIRERADDVGVMEHCRKDARVAVLYLRLLEHVRSFRWRHWLFAREYIIRRSSHPTATGGSPIVTWLPNQLFAVMDLMRTVWKGLSESERAESGKKVNEMMENVEDAREKLDKEVERWCQERGVPNKE